LSLLWRTWKRLYKKFGIGRGQTVAERQYVFSGIPFGAEGGQRTAWRQIGIQNMMGTDKGGEKKVSTSKRTGDAENYFRLIGT